MIKNLTYLFISIVLTFSLSVRSQNCLLEQEWQLDAISDNCEDYYEAWLESFDTEEAFVKIFKEDDNFRIFLINVLDGMIDHPASLTIWKRFGLINQDFEMLT